MNPVLAFVVVMLVWTISDFVAKKTRSLLAVAGAASFLTPVATPGNMMVMGPAGYRFGDSWRLGGGPDRSRSPRATASTDRSAGDHVRTT